MAFTLEQLKKKHTGVEPVVAKTLADIQREAEVRKQTQGNQFEQKPTSFLGKAREFVTSVIGGGELARGAGLGIAAKGVQEGMTEAELKLSDTALQLTKTINQRRKEGGDTSRLENALKELQADQSIVRDVQTDFTGQLPSNRAVIGSALRLGATAALPGLTGSIAKKFALGKASGFTAGALRGVATGATTGAVEGGVQGFGVGLEQDRSIKGSLVTGAIGAGTGAIGGGVIGGITGGITGAVTRAKDPNRIFEAITPKVEELTPTQYKNAVNKGLITPKTATQPAKYTLPKSEQEIALKYSNVIDKDPVRTSININNQIGQLDNEVGTFLRQNNGIFSKGELRNALKTSLDDISDVNIDEARLSKLKDNLINDFVKGLETNDMETLWIARKNYDQAIQQAFKGSPTLSKEAKVAFRNAVQDFISDRTPDQTYKGYMKDMTNLFRLRDTTLQKATKERALSGLSKWAKDNPKTAKTLGWGALVASGAIGASFLPELGFGGSKTD